MLRTCCISDNDWKRADRHNGELLVSVKKSTAAINFGRHLHIFMGSGYRVAHLSSLSLSLCAVHGYCFEWANVSGQTTSRASFVPLSAGYDFCAEGVICGENSECKNLNTKAECECRSGYASIHGDSTYCEGRTPERTVPGAVWATACQLLLCFWHHVMLPVIKAELCNKLADNKRTEDSMDPWVCPWDN